MKVYELYHVSEEKFNVTDKETGEIKEKQEWTKIGKGFQKEKKESISLVLDFTPIKKGYLHLIPKK